MKRKAIAKIAVLATGLSVALLAATINPAPVAQAYPTPPQSGCIGCHTEGGSVSATPSAATVAPGAAYTVTIAISGGSGNSGYWISGNGFNVVGSAAAGATRTQAMTAPTAAGSYTYNVAVRQGVASITTFSITVAPVATTPPPTTIPPTTVPPTTIPPTTVPPTTIPPTTVPPNPTPIRTVSGDVNMTPRGTLGKSHLSMYGSYGAMSCAACHNGIAQPPAPALSIKDADMKNGVACSSCHAPGKKQSDEPLFISQMNDPAKTVYTRCSSCHQIVSKTGSDDDGDDDGDGDGDGDDDGDRYGHQGDWD